VIANIRNAVLAMLDSEVRRNVALCSGDRAERLLEAVSDESAQVCRIHIVVRLLTGSDLFGVVPQADLPEISEGLSQVRHEHHVEGSAELDRYIERSGSDGLRSATHGSGGL
jgi:hypothetical protein